MKVEEAQQQAVKQSADFKVIVRRNLVDVLPIFHSIAQIAKVFYLLDIKTPYQFLTTEAHKINLSKAEATFPIKHSIIFASYWVAYMSKAKLTEIYLLTKDLIIDEVDKFFKLFNIKHEEIVSFLTDEEVAIKGLVYFASHQAADDYFYEEILPTLLHQKKMGEVLKNVRLDKKLKKNFLDFKKVYKDAVASGELEVRDGYIYAKGVEE